MTTRFLVFSDLHFHPFPYGATIVNGYNSRLLDQKAVLEQMFTYAEHHKIHDILFCGDMFHTHGVLSTEAVQLLLETFKPTKGLFDFYFIPGNHDYADKSKQVHSLHMLREFGKVFDAPTSTDLVCGPSLLALPYTESRHELEFELLKDRASSSHRTSVIIMHQGVNNVPVNSKGWTLNEILTVDLIPDGTAAAFSGHYHSFTRVDNRLTIPGSPLQLTWADKGEPRGWLDVKILNDVSFVTHVPSKAPQFVEIIGNTATKTEAEGNFVRHIVKGDTSVDKIREQSKELGARSVEVWVEDEKHLDLDPDANAEFDGVAELFEEYVRLNDIKPDLADIGRDIVNNTYENPFTKSE